MERQARGAGLWLSGTAMLCLALGACNKAPQADSQPVTGAPIAALQLATAPPPPPSYAPPASALPPAPRPVAYRPAPQHWRYLTDAYDMSDAFGDTPPDYTVPYDGEDPYIWRADDGAYRVVEWLPDGARSYYYEPGAEEPFLIQDPEYSYAYDNGALVAVYTLAGALVADRIAADRAGYAARYYVRGHDLYRAAQQDRRRAAYADNWRQRAPMIEAQRVRWQQGRQQQPGWQDWTRTHQAQQEQRWAPERQRRTAYAAALAANQDQRDRTDIRRTAEARPAPPPPSDRQERPGSFPRANRPDIAERHAEADRAQPGLLRATTPPPRAHGTHPTMADRHAPELRQPDTLRQNSASPDRHGMRGPEERVAARQQAARAAVAQQRPPQQPPEAQPKQANRTEQALYQDARRAGEAQRRNMHQAQQAQRHEAHQALQAQRSRMQQDRQVQGAPSAPQRPPARAEISRPQQQRGDAPHPTAQHVEMRPSRPAVTPQQHGPGNGRARQDPRRHQ